MTRRAAIVVDVDGTVALRTERSPFDERRVGEDVPNEAVVTCVRALVRDGHYVIFVTGRSERVRMQTAIWLRAHVIDDFDLLMRGKGDVRPDFEIKAEMLTAIEPAHRIALVFDDRDSVVAMWRARGYTCLQVAPGSF